MKQSIIAALVIGAMMSSCQTSKESSREVTETDTVQASPVTLKLKWETDSVLTTNESVLYDQERDILYVSNINGVPDAKDNNGFISKVSLDGKVSELQWVKNLHAPKGMGLSGNKLYVTDIDRVVEIDVTSGKITKAFAVEGAKFLNDITVDKDGRIFVSDMGAGTILKIENGNLTKWVENVTGPNGLLSEGDKFFVLLWDGKTVNTLDPATRQLTVLADSLENLDGIEAVGDGGYLVSSWNGMVHYIDRQGKNYTVLDTRADSVNSADIEYVREKNLLLVPTFFHNTVRAYELSR